MSAAAALGAAGVAAVVVVAGPAVAGRGLATARAVLAVPEGEGTKGALR